MAAAGAVIKPSELRALTDAQLAFVVVRCALRTEPWLGAVEDKARGAAARKAWRSGASFLADAAAKGAWSHPRAFTSARSINQASARLASTSEEASYALLALSNACQALAVSVDRKAFVKEAILTGKYAASIAAMCAHAGRIKANDVGAAKDAKAGTLVDGAVKLVWDAARADIARCVTGERIVGAAEVATKLWPKRAPAFWPQ